MKNITIIGSIRFEEFMNHLKDLLEDRGYHVTCPSKKAFTDDKELKDYKDFYLMQIENSDLVIIYNKYDYIGSDTYNEIEYSKNNHIPILECSHFFDEDISIHDYMNNKEKYVNRFSEFDKHYDILEAVENFNYKEKNY